MAIASTLPLGFAHSFAILVRTSNPSVVLLLPSATTQFLAGKLNLSQFFRFSFNVSSVSHTDSYSFPLLACSAAGLRACACAEHPATFIRHGSKGGGDYPNFGKCVASTRSFCAGHVLCRQHNASPPFHFLSTWFHGQCDNKAEEGESACAYWAVLQNN